VVAAGARRSAGTSTEEDIRATRTRATGGTAGTARQHQPADGPTPVRTQMEKDCAGDITGHGVATFLQTRNADGSATFCALERVTRSIDGR
jgi:hypothetical protein